jgi:hypothetical protein
MDDPIQAQRKTRLRDLLEQKYDGDKAALGRALDFKDGSYIGQLLRGERPITEKLIAKIHTKSGCAGWFSPALEMPSMDQLAQTVDQLKREVARLGDAASAVSQASRAELWETAVRRAAAEYELRRTSGERLKPLTPAQFLALVDDAFRVSASASSSLARKTAHG